MKFEDAKGDFTVEQRYIEFPEVTLKGPIAQIASRGNYDLEEGDLVMILGYPGSTNRYLSSEAIRARSP